MKLTTQWGDRPAADGGRSEQADEQAATCAMPGLAVGEGREGEAGL